MQPRLTAVMLILCGCVPDPPDTIAAAQHIFVPIVVDAKAEARTFNGGAVYEFVADSTGYVRMPHTLPAGNVMITLTYTGATPAPHSLIFAGLNGDEPVVAVDVPGSNNGTITVPPGGLDFYDGAPGNRAAGYEGKLTVTGAASPDTAPAPAATLSWSTTGIAFTASPHGRFPANVPVALQLTVGDQLPHSVAFENVRGGEPLVAVDGPGTNHRVITLPPGTYVYYCAVPGHRAAGMEGLVTVG